MTTEVTHPFLDHGLRYDVPENEAGLTGMDHVGLGVRDPLEGGKFVEQVLGGIEVYRAGYSDKDIELGRLKHIFYHVGTTLVEVAEQKTEDGYPVAATENTQPHWAFGTSATGLFKFVDRLKDHGIPFNGPRSHLGMSAVSVYFRDPDGNNLEAVTWEEVPEDQVTPMGGPFGFPDWTALACNWTPRD
ncbi:VOC family protein [Streptomyces blattellae]|uniref:VOC family protein n=1 Tax=Streptomyces blattellae TaxID=2569855 RepID=UPI0012B74B4B|nr:VOC family protein [Streptomyces blattellae]